MKTSERTALMEQVAEQLTRNFPPKARASTNNTERGVKLGKKGGGSELVGAAADCRDVLD